MNCNTEAGNSATGTSAHVGRQREVMHEVDDRVVAEFERAGFGMHAQVAIRRRSRDRGVFLFLERQCRMALQLLPGHSLVGGVRSLDDEYKVAGSDHLILERDRQVEPNHCKFPRRVLPVGHAGKFSFTLSLSKGQPGPTMSSGRTHSSYWAAVTCPERAPPRAAPCPPGAPSSRSARPCRSRCAARAPSRA